MGIGDDEKTQMGKGIILFLLGCLAGCSNESGACTLIVALFFYVVCIKIKKRRLLGQYVLGIIGVIIGFAILMLAPGNFVRGAKMGANSPEALSIIYRFLRATYYGLRYNLILLVLWFYLSFSTRRKLINNEGFLFWILSFVNIYVFVFSTGFSIRTLLVSVVLGIVSVSRALIDYSFEYFISPDKRKKIAWFAMCFLFVFVLLEFTTGMVQHKTKDTIFDRQMQYFYSSDDLF